MRLRSLELRNYRRYLGHHEIVFPEGVVGLLGPNGAGKSTLIEALAWAFYGQAAARTSAEGLRSSTVSTSEPVSVAVEFELAGEVYRVVRSLKGKGLTAEALLHRGNEQLAEGAKDVSAAIARRLGLDWRSFYTTIFTRQKELNAFSALTHTERKGMVERLLGVSLLDEVVRKIRETNRHTASRLEDRRSRTVDEAGRSKLELLQERKEMLQERGARLAEERVDLDIGVLRAKDSLQQAKTAWRAAQQNKERHHARDKLLAQSRARAHAAKEALTALRQRLKGLETQEEELTRMESHLAGLADAKRALQDHERSKEKLNRRTRLKEELERLVIQRQKKEEYRDSVKSELESKPDPTPQLRRLSEHRHEVVATRDELVHKIGDLQGEAKALEGQSSSVRLHLQQIETLGAKGNCPACERPLEEHQPNLVVKYRRQLDDNTVAQGQLRARKDDLEKELDEASARLRELKRQEDRYNSIRADSAGLKARLDGLKVELAGFEESIKTAENELAELVDLKFDNSGFEEARARVEDLQKLAGTVEELKKATANRPKLESELSMLEHQEAQALFEIDEHERALAELAFNDGAHALLEKEYTSALDHLRRAEVNLAGHEARRVSVQMELETTLTDLNEQNEWLREIREIETDGAYHGRLEELFKSFREHLLSRVAPSLAGYTSELIGPLTQGRYTQVQVDSSTYEIKMYDGAQAYPIARFSGGETDLVNLALRLAISRLLAERSGAELNLIILDEIFGSQDDQRRMAIMAGLQNLGHRFGQIILITHIDQIKELVERALRVEETPEGGARVIEG